MKNKEKKGAKKRTSKLIVLETITDPYTKRLIRESEVLNGR